jgi:Arc/MetJ-type ribon-helix-helix transcriptional regulator
MSLTLSAETQKLIEERMTRGGYSSPDELVRDALNLLDHVEDEEQLDEETLAAIDQAEEEIDRGECRDWEEVKAELRAKYLGE